MATDTPPLEVIFSHGKESGPWGFKIKRLASIAKARHCAVDSIDYRQTQDPDERIGILQERLTGDPANTLLVGSSMGGYVALAATETFAAAGLFLMAPALYIPGWQRQRYPSRAACIEIVHGWDDDVIPVENSIKFARNADCELHLVSGDHPLNRSIETVESLFVGCLERVLRERIR